MVPIDDEELVRDIAVILAAYSQKFPQLRGKAVRPDLRDEARHRFAEELVSRLRRGKVRVFMRVHAEPDGNSKWFGVG